MNRESPSPSRAQGASSKRSAGPGAAALASRADESAAIDPFGPGGEFDETVPAGALLSQAAYDALAAAADEAAACAFAASEAQEEGHSERSEFVDAVLPRVYANRYDRAFLKDFWMVAEAMTERIQAARGGTVRLAAPVEEIAFYAACAMRGRIADGRLDVERVCDENRAAVVREIERYYAVCRVDGAVEALYRLPRSAARERESAPVGPARLDFENW